MLVRWHIESCNGCKAREHDRHVLTCPDKAGLVTLVTVPASYISYSSLVTTPAQPAQLQQPKLAATACVVPQIDICL